MTHAPRSRPTLRQKIGKKTQASAARFHHELSRMVNSAMPPIAARVVFAACLPFCLMAQPRYTADGQLALPSDYREWVFLSSGLGMTYQQLPNHSPEFTNVFA